VRGDGVPWQMLKPEVLMLVPGCESGEAPCKVAELAHGKINHTLLVATRAGEFVVRLCGADAGRLGVDRRRELALQRMAASAQLAPAVLAVSADARASVSRFIPGRAWSSADLGDAHRVERFGLHLRELHALARPVEISPTVFDPLRHLRNYAVQVVRAVPEDAPLIEAAVARAATAFERGGSAARGAAVTHLDLHPDNVIECEPQRERLVFIDWEYGAWADPALDLAATVAIEPAIAPHLERLIEASGLGRVLSREQLESLRLVFEATHWLWYRACRLAGPAAAAERAVEARLFERLMLARF
jgi:aminoglycoside phosphotransferase (APT) family kinase protein